MHQRSTGAITGRITFMITLTCCRMKRRHNRPVCNQTHLTLRTSFHRRSVHATWQGSWEG